MKTLILSIVILISMNSCTDFVDQPHYFVDPSLKIFTDRFYFEAKKRNVNVGKEMTMILTTDLNTNFTGTYGLTIYGLKEIKIDSAFTINKLSRRTHEDSLNVEFVVFHEIGHLLLHRGHEPYPVYSIMEVDDQWLYDYQTDPYKRKILIDELFITY